MYKHTSIPCFRETLQYYFYSHKHLFTIHILFLFAIKTEDDVDDDIYLLHCTILFTIVIAFIFAFACVFVYSLLIFRYENRNYTKTLIQFTVFTTTLLLFF